MQDTRNCKTDCREKLVCTSCGTQLCSIEELPNPAAQQKLHCANGGFYMIGDKMICIECRIHNL